MNSRNEASCVTLGSGNLRDAVRLPFGEDQNEWLAMNLSDMYNQVCMLVGTLDQACTPEKCPKMTAAAGHEYLWQDSNKQTLSTSAPEYISYLLTGIHDQLDDENVFPSQLGKSFPPDFLSICEGIMSRLFRVYAHVYHAHSNDIIKLNAMAHINTSLKHFILFAREFKLIPRAKMVPLQSVLDTLCPANS
ncbi:unnamed protein product, partial [Mesorhabditis belari]|uniref:Uncharacterized protein n=1 Tax=Mesorhabditis belari TaxID=2138241 RepID=A0AAF3J6Q2_9BILA